MRLQHLYQPPPIRLQCSHLTLQVDILGVQDLRFLDQILSTLPLLHPALGGRNFVPLPAPPPPILILWRQSLRLGFRFAVLVTGLLQIVIVVVAHVAAVVVAAAHVVVVAAAPPGVFGVGLLRSGAGVAGG